MADDLTLYPMIPENELSTPEEDLAAAIASQLDVAPQAVPLPDEEQVPLGRTWEFDFEAARFVRAGGAPAVVRGSSSLAQWCLMAIHSARYQHDAFDDDFGMEGPGDPIGEFAVGEVVADWQAHLEDALLLHDRVVAIQNLELDWDPVEGVLTVLSLDVVTDEDDAVSLGDVQVQVGGLT